MTDLAALPEGTHTVALGAADLNGILRGKRVAAAQWPEVAAEGLAMAATTFAMDLECELLHSRVHGWADGFPDVLARPLHAPRAIPWEPGVAFALARPVGLDGAAFALDPRGALERQVARAAGLGLEVRIGAELEFYVLDPATRRPADADVQVYGLERGARMEPILGPIRRDLAAMGLGIEQSNPEYAPGQAEVNLRHAPALEAADQAVAFRSMVREIAERQGRLATFMAKPFAELSGSGLHAHVSVWRDGRNIFADGGRLSAEGRAWLAGLQRRMPEASLAGTTTVNAHRRRRPDAFCAINDSWGVDNRTAGLRVIEGRDAAVRIETRAGAADCNPHLLFAAEIAAGLEGLEQGLAPRAPVTGDAFRAEGQVALPADPADALRAARASAFLEDALGAPLVEVLAGQLARELALLADHVTELELRRGLAAL